MEFLQMAKAGTLVHISCWFIMDIYVYQYKTGYGACYYKANDSLLDNNSVFDTEGL